MGNKRTYAEARQFASVYNDCQGNLTAVATELSLPRSTVQGRHEAIRDKWPRLFKKFAPAKGGNPHRAIPATIDEHVEAQQRVDSESAERAKLKDAARLIAELREKITKLEWAAKMDYKPAEWTRKVRVGQGSEHMVDLLTSDFQLGEVIKEEETEAGYGFDSKVFIRRYRQMIDTVLYLSESHAGEHWTFPGILYERGGDTISGGIHDELRETDDLTPIEAVQLAFEEESAGISKLADYFGRVEVKTPGAAGNHDRNTFKPQSKNAVGHSYDALIAFMLANHFKADKRVTFQTSKSFDIRFKIYNQNILLTHGDRMGSRGGQGFIGPAATILRGVQKVMTEQAALGFHVDCVHHGHFHYPMWLPFVLSNGCMPGYSEYAKQFRMRPQPPQQALQYHHHKLGMVDMKPIYLT